MVLFPFFVSQSWPGHEEGNGVVCLLCFPPLDILNPAPDLYSTVGRNDVEETVHAPDFFLHILSFGVALDSVSVLLAPLKNIFSQAQMESSEFGPWDVSARRSVRLMYIKVSHIPALATIYIQSYPRSLDYTASTNHKSRHTNSLPHRTLV